MREGVTLVDPYDRLYGRSDLFLSDSVHFNGREKAELARMIEGRCGRALIEESKTAVRPFPRVTPLGA